MNQFVCFVLFKVLFPIGLIGSIIFRFNAFSLVYLLLFLVTPLIPSPTNKNLHGHTGRFLIAVLCISLIISLSHLSFQIYLLSNSPYGGFLNNCDGLEIIFRYVGFVRYNHLNALDVARHIAPEVIMLLLSVILMVAARKRDPDAEFDIRTQEEGSDRPAVPLSSEQYKSRSEDTSVTTAIGYFLDLLLMASAGIIRPCMMNAFYFLSFMAFATWIALYNKLSKKFMIFRIFLMIYAGLHLITLYVYQFAIMQELIPYDNLYARLFGLTNLIRTDCADPREIHFFNVEWASFANPGLICILYWVLAIQTRSYLSTKFSTKTKSTERSPLLDSQHVIPTYQAVGMGGEEDRLEIDPNGSAIWSSNPSEMPLDAEAPEDGFKSLKQWLSPIISIFQLITRQSYIATLIIMMAWSITYHSWLTFVLLLWSCILWMMPNSRQACWKSSPFLVIYAEALIVIQYIYGLNLSDSELPQTVDNINLAEIGLKKTLYLPCIPLSVKILYTVMFWITLRQYMQEKYSEKNKDIAEGVMMQPVSMAYVTVQPGTQSRPDLQRQQSVVYSSALMKKVGSFVHSLLTKYWIWIVALMLLLNALGGKQVVVFRIIYMVLFLFFILMFQLSYKIWRVIMYGFWLTVIIYSMMLLILIYTYQFENFQTYWEEYLHISRDLQRDIGLEFYDTGGLFINLLRATFFVIITIIQLHYFHNEFLRISDIELTTSHEEPGTDGRESEGITTHDEGTGVVTEPTSPSDTTAAATSPETSPAQDTKQPNTDDEPTKATTKEPVLRVLQNILHRAVYVYNIFSDICWRYLEIHVIKIVLFSVLLLALYDVCAVNFIFVMFVVIAMPIRSVQTFFSHCCALWAAVLLISKMIYQINYVHEYWKVNCTENSEIFSVSNGTINNAHWVGFEKVDNLTGYIKGYLGLIFVLTIQAVVKIRMRHHRKSKKEDDPKVGIMFPEITRLQADNGLLDCTKFLINYGFYKFGFEICLVTISAGVGSRLDLFAVIYALWLAALFLLRRRTLMKVWPLYVIFLCCILPIQYLMCVGLPPGLCLPYVYYGEIDPELREWLFLPDYIKPPHAYKLTVDFLLLLFACCQLWVFSIESKPNANEYEGGSNEEIVYLPNYPANNTMSDFVTCTKSYLDLVKVGTFFSLYWVTLAIFFLAGTNRVSLFAMGYVIGCFLFLWNGQEFFLKPIAYILRWWNVLITYTIIVIFLKSILQLIGCVFLKDLYQNFCWLIQLLGIACLKKFEKGGTQAFHESLQPDDCQVPVDEAGLLWEGICLFFLLMQKRFFCSYYFPHLVTEMRAQAALANRGAELINQMLTKEVLEQQAAEKEIVEKIKKKMDKIRMHQQKIRGSEYVDPDSHYTAIRSGDYYLFEDFSDDEGLAELEYGSKKQKEQDADDDETPVKGIPVTKLLASAMKTDIKQAVAAAKQAKGADSDLAGSEPTTSGPTDRSGKTPVSRTVSGASAVSFAPSPRDSLTPYDAKRPQPHSSPQTLSDGRKMPVAQPEDSEVLGTSTMSGHDEPGKDDDEKSKSKENLIQRIQNLLRFLWVFLEGLMISLTAKLNNISRDYRYVARCLSKEKKALKEKWQVEGFDETYEKSTSKIPEEALAIRVEKPSDEQTDDSVVIHETPEVLEKEFEAEQPPIVRLLVASWNAAVSRSEIVCYIMIVINQIKSASILSLPLPLMAFLWGTLSIPRPSKTFWITIITYTEAIVVIKYLFQFGFFPWNATKEPANKPFAAARIMGIEKQDQYALYDLALLLVVFFHRFILKSLGLWKDTSHSDADVTNGQGSVEEKEVDTSKLSDFSAAEKDSFSVSQKEETTVDQTNAGSVIIGFLQYVQPIRSFIDNLLNPPYRVTRDVYAFMFVCDFITFLIVVFGYWAFGTGGGDGVASYFEENKVPIPFLIMLIAQFGLIVADRALFLRKYILGKLIFQIFIVFLVHIWMFFLLPLVTERQFNSNLPPQLWYFVKCMYLLLSAYQIRSGYPTRILGNFLTKKYNYVNLILFKCFMAVPFLFELRALMDWIWTDTSMAIGSWLKMEDIFANIFVLKCTRWAESEYPVPRGQKRNPVVKYGVGGTLLFIIILIIWFPLVLFALGNTVGLPNRPTGCTIEVSFSGFEPIFKMSAQIEDLKQITDSQYESMKYQYRSNPSAQTFLSNYDSEDVYVAQLSGSSTSYWIISPPSQEKLVSDLNSNSEMNVKFSWQFFHATTGKDADAMVGDEYVKLLPPNETARIELAKMIKSMGSQGGSTKYVTINNLMPKYIRVPSKGKAQVAKALQLPPYHGLYNNLSLLLKKEPYATSGDKDSKVFWMVQEDCENNPHKRLAYLADECGEIRPNLTMVSFNDKVFPATLSILSGYGIIGLYTTLVLVASRFVRGIFSGVSYTIMFDDMPNVDRVLQLCLDIYLVRESGELKLEEDLFAKLIFLYRSPETLIKWTRYPHMENQQQQRRQQNYPR